MQKLSVFLIAALFITLTVFSARVVKADVEVIITNSCGCETSSPTPTVIPTASPTIVPTPTEIPTPTPTTEIDVCPNLDGIQTNIPDTYHLDAAGRNCVQFQLGGPPPPPDLQGQVLGVSTSVLAATDSDLILPRVIVGMIFGGIIFFVIKKYII